MMIQQVFCVLLLAIACDGRQKTNCGLACYRWEKCMGQLDGSNRPGQLGDTGIIVLTQCSTQDLGCECAKLLTEAAADKPSASPVATAAAASSEVRSSGIRQRSGHLRVPRKQDPELFKVSSDETIPVPASSLQDKPRPVKRYTSRRHISAAFGADTSKTTEAKTTETKTTIAKATDSRTARASLFSRHGRIAFRNRA